MRRGKEKSVIVIEGQIGAGKTTLGSLLSDSLRLPFYQELNNDATSQLLDKFYKDQYRWSFAMQIHFLNERFHLLKEIFKQGGGILDRCLFGDRVFADVLYQQGKMTREEYATYIDLLVNMLEHAQNPTVMIYLDCSVDTAMVRIKKRNRGLEANIPREYLQMLNEHYLAWFDSYDFSPKIKIDYDDFDIFKEENKDLLLSKIFPYLQK